MTENSTALLFDILDTATQGDPDSAANNIALLNQLLTETGNNPSNISANEIALLTEILSIITDQPSDVAANEIALLTEILSAIQTQNPQVRENKIALLNEIAANSQSLVDALALPVAASDLVAWHPFRQGDGSDATAGDSRFADATDYSATVNGATFKPSGGARDIKTGANSGAFEFDGTDDDISNVRGLGGTGVTILAQINISNQNSDFARVYSSFEKGQTGGYEIGARTADDRINADVGDSSGTAAVRTSVSGLKGQFGQVGLRYDGQTLDLIKKGAVVDSAAVSVNPPQRQAKIGYRDNGFNVERFGGIIDSVRIYDATLSDSQINQIHLNTQP